MQKGKSLRQRETVGECGETKNNIFKITNNDLVLIAFIERILGEIRLKFGKRECGFG